MPNTDSNLAALLGGVPNKLLAREAERCRDAWATTRRARTVLDLCWSAHVRVAEPSRSDLVFLAEPNARTARTANNFR